MKYYKITTSIIAVGGFVFMSLASASAHVSAPDRSMPAAGAASGQQVAQVSDRHCRGDSRWATCSFTRNGNPWESFHPNTNPPAPPRGGGVIQGRGDPGGICTNAAMGAAVSQDVIRMCENLGWRF